MIKLQLLGHTFLSKLFICHIGNTFFQYKTDNIWLIFHIQLLLEFIGTAVYTVNVLKFRTLFYFYNIQMLVFGAGINKMHVSIIIISNKGRHGTVCLGLFGRHQMFEILKHLSIMGLFLILMLKVSYIKHINPLYTETPKRVLLQTVNNTIFFYYNRIPLDMYNGLSQVYISNIASNQ